VKAKDAAAVGRIDATGTAVITGSSPNLGGRYGARAECEPTRGDQPKPSRRRPSVSSGVQSRPAVQAFGRTPWAEGRLRGELAHWPGLV